MAQPAVSTSGAASRTPPARSRVTTIRYRQGLAHAAAARRGNRRHYLTGVLAAAPRPPAMTLRSTPPSAGSRPRQDGPRATHSASLNRRGGATQNVSSCPGGITLSTDCDWRHRQISVYARSGPGQQPQPPRRLLARSACLPVRRTTDGPATAHYAARRPGRLGADDSDPRCAAPRPGPAAARHGRPCIGPGPLGTFRSQLRFHLAAEHAAMWPRVRPQLAGDPHGQALLDAMDDERQLLGPLQAMIDDAFTVDADPRRLR